MFHDLRVDLRQKRTTAMDGSSRPPTPYPVFRKTCKMASDPEKKKEEDIAGYWRELLQKSMLTGVPQIVAAPTTRSKVFKTFVLLGSITGFLYQTSAFLVIYFSYPTLVDVQVTTPPFVDVPGITICNRNGLRRREYCRIKPNMCEPLEDLGSFCSKYSTACINGELIGGNMFPKEEALVEEARVVQSVIQKIGHRSYPLVSRCEFEVVNVSFDFCKNETFKQFVFQDMYGKMKQCYIINALWSKKALNHPKVPTRAVLKLVLDLEPEESFRLDRVVAGQMAIHSAWDVINPFQQGFTVKPKKSYRIHIKENIKNLLPYPYQTNCTDYIVAWQSRGLYGPLSKEMCMEECVLNQTLDNCQCVLNSNLYPHNFKFCGEETDICTEKVNYTHCFVKCAPACHSRSFEYKVEEEDSLLPLLNSIADVTDVASSGLQGSQEASAAHYNWNRTTVIFIIFKRTEVNIYRYRPKYESIEFFSFLGGFIGIWLGVSLIAVLDFIESVSTFFVFLFDRLKSSSISDLKTRIRTSSTFSSDSLPWATSRHRDRDASPSRREYGSSLHP
ncbi:acid-sensing ion channel 1C-like [Uloborus diversus]|uniref:acid-sensing ion channel 1C-like n=1 Tax=Uloborus diversus TaxID=327109 RepID=UPI00240A179C|nr:acid-sensing ion channel 1C-like [Uloborus diversus]